MNNGWAHTRKMIYALGIIVVIVLACIYVFRDTLFPTPTCSDQKQNGYETGVDCGGVCSLRCSSEVIPLSVVWSRALPTSPSTYDFAALVANRNIDNAPRGIAYVFVAYDKDGKEMIRTTGSTTAPIDGDFPIIVQNVKLPQPPSDVIAVVGANVPHYTVKEKPAIPTIKVTDTRFEPGSIPRFYATITNTKRLVIHNLPVRVLLYDADGNVYAAGETVIPELGKEAVQEIVITWDRAFAFPPTKTRVFPILDPFLGSL